jgi:GNAT superfamily N-acetyltransferase
MGTGDIHLRLAERTDAACLASLAALASDGFVTRLWAQFAEGDEPPIEVGARRIADEEGTLSWRNGVLALIDGAVAGGMVTSRIGLAPEAIEPLPAMLRPMQVLKNRALGAHYVNILAVLPPFRRRGVARVLLGEATRLAEGAVGLCLVVADGNVRARRLYENSGFRAVAEEAMVKGDWRSDSETWLLMLKPSAPRGAPCLSAARSPFKSGCSRAT